MHSNRQTKTIRVIGITLMVTALLMVGSRSAGAQSEQAQKAPPSLEELKKRLLQLEQAVQELKGQINATEEHVWHPDSRNQFRSILSKSCERERYDVTQ
jgi:hypothetical protein